MTPDLHELANVMLALRCATGTAARDVDDCHTVVREPCYLMARNLAADPGPLLAALLGRVDPDELAAMRAAALEGSDDRCECGNEKPTAEWFCSTCDGLDEVDRPKAVAADV